jgi:hypothetical protein
MSELLEYVLGPRSLGIFGSSTLEASPSHAEGSRDSAREQETPARRPREQGPRDVDFIDTPARLARTSANSPLPGNDAMSAEATAKAREAGLDHRRRIRGVPGMHGLGDGMHATWQESPGTHPDAFTTTTRLDKTRRFVPSTLS